MFEIDRDKKRLSKLDTKTFGELKIREREDLQEWLANCPSALGEELLIIQKEFDGFKDTNERLDLLALDKSGSLVIIENKLDDSGRDVVWQALKYVAYCSTLKKSDIVQIYADYLKKQGTSDDAEGLICDFLEFENIDEAEINVSNNQRFILVAAKFRKEVTSTVIWLINNGIRGQCMTVTPYPFKGKLLLCINQILPTPEIEEYMIVMSSKQREENAGHAALARNAPFNSRFWEQLLDHFRKNKFEMFANITHLKNPYISAGSGVTGLQYFLILGQTEVRVDFYINRLSKEENKRIFDFLFSRKDKIESRFEGTLEWKRLDDKKSSKICCDESFDSIDESNWSEMAEWLLVQAKKMENALKPEIKDIQK